jgi:hypothetical protein
MRGATGAGPPRHASTTRPTPIRISHRVQIALIIGVTALLVLAVWRVPAILTIVIGTVALALILSFPVSWVSRVMPRGLAILETLLLLLVNNEWLLALCGVASVLFQVLQFAFPGEGALSLLWLISVYAILFAVLLIALGIPLRGLRGTIEAAAAHRGAR